jgi:fructose-1,6-bisphosphatase/inositol monophosphatase family enzyme
MLVAEGSVDAAVDARLAPWDYAALVPIVEEAGGLATALDGGLPRPREQFVSSNGLIHGELPRAAALELGEGLVEPGFRQEVAQAP